MEGIYDDLRERYTDGPIMLMIGSYGIPERSLSQCVEVAEQLGRKLGGTAPRVALARMLGMSERGGAFAAKIAGMRSWHIVHGRGTLRLTAAGQQVAMPRSVSEKTRAMRDLALSVPIVGQLSGRFASWPPEPSDLGLALEDITGEDRASIRPLLKSVSRVLEELGQLISLGPDHELNESPSAGIGGSRVIDRDSWIEISLGNTRISMPETAANLEAAILVLRARMERNMARSVRSLT